MSNAVMLWWSALCAVALANVIAWGGSARALGRSEGILPESVYRTRRLLLWLSAVYVLGCGFRSVLPMVDVPRICLHDTALSRIFVGRTVATVAELCVISQFALLLHEAGVATAHRFAVHVSHTLLPLIVLAEAFSWFAVLTANYSMHAAENSLWTLAAALALAGFADVRPRLDPRGKRFVAAVLACGALYVAFMVFVDVPMYLSRWQIDRADGHEVLSLSAGLREILNRCSVVREWAAWREDIPWLTLYFSVAVWISIAVAHAPPLLPPAGPPRGR
jgi:hypothetical protein